MTHRPPHGFQAGMKVEAVDKRNPMLIRVATIVDTEDHRLKIHFDGWNMDYDYWVETDCPDLHPLAGVRIQRGSFRRRLCLRADLIWLV
uniref:Uncharacterized protein n=1 Tax=Fundulus heteroclitus TaxID=8078 RepID=A0A3Q2PIL3_FUNHE